MKTITFVAMEPTSSVAHFMLVDQALRLLESQSICPTEKYNVQFLYFPERLLRPNNLNFSFEVANNNITFTRVFPSLYRLALSFFSSTFFSLLLIYKFIVNNNDIQVLSFKGVFIGDSLLSIALRRSSNPSFKLGFRFCLYLFRAVNIIQLIKCLKINQKANFFLLFDWHYFERILYRCLVGGEAKLVDSLGYEKSNSVINIDILDNYFPFIVKKSNSLCVKSSKEKVHEFFKARLSDPGSFQWYLKGNGNLTSDQILDECGKTITLPENGYVACIFLHSFVDGYVDTIWDGFLDQLKYLEFLIEKLLYCGLYEKILIKPHPQTFSAIYPTDEKGIQCLKRRFGDSLTFLNKRASLVALSKGNVVCFSHHGSVVEECHYLGMPCIGFKHGPWREYSKFLYTWESKSDLAKLIHKGPKNLPHIESDYFYKYIFEYRLAHQGNIRSPFLESAAREFSIEYNQTFEFGHAIAKSVKRCGLADSLRRTAIEYKSSIN